MWGGKGRGRRGGKIGCSEDRSHKDKDIRSARQLCTAKLKSKVHICYVFVTFPHHHVQ